MKANPKHTRNPRGPLSPEWKGGRIGRGGGYIGSYMPAHPRADTKGYVAEHILVVETHTGVVVVAPREVHHVNGDRADNRPENLVLCEDRAYHRLLHRRQEAVAAGFPAHFRLCRYCGKYDDPVLMAKAGYSYTHRICRSLAMKEYRRRVSRDKCGQKLP